MNVKLFLNPKNKISFFLTKFNMSVDMLPQIIRQRKI